MTRYNHRTVGFGTGGNYMPLVRYFNFISLEDVDIEEQDELKVTIESNPEIIITIEDIETSISIETNELETKIEENEEKKVNIE
ncbi:MAG: hypothetical protein GY853_16050 [PVC group bacterium]|nr:hypothetical protein [PVC group bacterium]